MRPLPTDIQLPENYTPSPLKARYGYRRQVRAYEVITPIFGGGLEAGIPDPEMPVNGKTIRGQLRFWWRATRGGQFGGDLAAMKACEDAIWGKGASPEDLATPTVQIAVKITRKGNLRAPFEVVAGKADFNGRPRPVVETQPHIAPAYVAFPLQPTQEEVRNGRIGMETKKVLCNCAFELEISYPLFRDPHNPQIKGNREVEAALWAWETFGGVGGRTRRGFGSLQLTSVNGKEATGYLAPSPEQLLQFHQPRFRAAFVTDTGTPALWPTGVPHLQTLVLPAIQGSPNQVWNRLIQHYKTFRQAKPPKQEFGRSLWPEPDSIRLITDDGHHAVDNWCEKFPRGEFGLPIIFHFKDNEVRETTLQGVSHDRLASPLLLKPLCSASGPATALVAVLSRDWPPSDGADDLPANMTKPLRLKGAPTNPIVDAQITPDDLTEISAVARRRGGTFPMGSCTDPVEAFLESLPKNTL